MTVIQARIFSSSNACNVAIAACCSNVGKAQPCPSVSVLLEPATESSWLCAAELLTNDVAIFCIAKKKICLLYLILELLYQAIEHET